MTHRQLERLVAVGEGQHLEFKRQVPRPQRLAKEVIAFANSGGGHLLLGVDDDTVRRWRAGPKSGRHLEMSEAQFREFEDSLGRWLERQNT